MTTEIDTQQTSLDWLKIAIALVFLAGGIAAFYYFDQYHLLIRVAMVLSGSIASIALVYFTTIGRSTWEFTQESWTEAQKVVWPGRQETIQATAGVLIMVILVAIGLWLLDMFLVFITRLLMGGG
ncbi:MAG TPA: preprotein translocase subunit SecE [Gammaproteobacteria bacterium]|nr:preprotein translocase subunit SecE [Gammaproteobacteria bacterium]